jgi:hypothetical protein
VDRYWLSDGWSLLFPFGGSDQTRCLIEAELPLSHSHRNSGPKPPNRSWALITNPLALTGDCQESDRRTATRDFRLSDLGRWGNPAAFFYAEPAILWRWRSAGRSHASSGAQHLLGPLARNSDENVTAVTPPRQGTVFGPPHRRGTAMTSHLTAKIVSYFAVKPGHATNERPAPSLVWTIDPATGKPIGQWTIADERFADTDCWKAAA